jgi:hypothetical protein
MKVNNTTACGRRCSVRFHWATGYDSALARPHSFCNEKFQFESTEPDTAEANVGFTPAFKTPFLISGRYSLTTISRCVRLKLHRHNYTFSAGYFCENQMLRKTLHATVRQMVVEFLDHAGIQLSRPGGAK